MNKIVLPVLLLFACMHLHAQTIKGRVYGADKDSILAGASVYYSGSTTGTTTDKDGRFELQARQQQIPVIASFIGYYSATVNYEPGKPLVIHLKPKAEALHEVTIRVNGMDRREEIAIFMREFIGNSTYANSCTIKNMYDIDLFYSKKTGILTASCDKPIIIENKKLGYTISYYLDNFERTFKKVLYAGNYIFKDNLPSSPKEQAKVISNREDAYIGSRMQFIRALWREEVDKIGFKIYTPTLQSLYERDVMKHDSLMQKYVVLEKRVFVYHTSDMRHSSSLTPVTKVSYIDKDGYYGTGLEWGGLMGNQRVGDLLPFEYQPPTDFKANVSKVKKDSTNKTIVITTNKKPEDKYIKLFKSIVLVNDNPMDKQSVVRKWAQPIRYKIYGTCGNKKLDSLLARFAKSVFNRVSGKTSLQIKNVTDNDPVNFFILMNEDADDYKNILPTDAVSYFATHKQSSGYYSYNENGFTSMVKLIDLKNLNDPVRDFPAISYMLRQHIMNGLGFFNFVSPYPGSTFYNNIVLNSDPDSDASDDYIIKSLYQPTIKSGMTKQELDNVLTNKKL